MIKNTNANCKIKEVKVTNTTAYITVTFYSHAAAETNKAFQFYIKENQTLTLLNNNFYWIDRNNNYDNNISNIDINLYKDIILEVDITNQNQSSMQDNRWIRDIQLVLKDTTTNENAWFSETLNLISKEIELPSIENLDFITDSSYNLTVKFKYVYDSQQDFNYNNNNLYTVINIRALHSEQILESIIISEESLDSYVTATFLNPCSQTVIIEIL